MFEEMLSKLKEAENANKVPFLGNPDEHAALMAEKYALLSEDHTFKLGDLVVFKAGLKNTCWPADGEPVVVTEFNYGAIDPQESCGSNRYRAPVDLRILLMDADGDFEEFWVDARRFQPFKPTR